MRKRDRSRRALPLAALTALLGATAAGARPLEDRTPGGTRSSATLPTVSADSAAARKPIRPRSPFPDDAKARSARIPLNLEPPDVSTPPRSSPTTRRLPPSPPPPPIAGGLDAALIEGRPVQPIDLVNVLRLAGARDLDIAIARRRIDQSLADLERARSLWLPSFFLGPTYYRADGQVQTITGQVINVNRGSLFLGGTAASVNGFPAPSPGTGYPQLNSLSSVLRISDMIYEPLANRRMVDANRAGFRAATNDALLAAAEAYLDLQTAGGRLAIAREAAGNAETLAAITASYAKNGEGTEADHRRALAEFRQRRRGIQAASGQLLVASTNLTRLLVLNPRIIVAPVEPSETILRLVPEDRPLGDFICQAFRNRPELAQSQELVQAALVRLKQAKLRPFVPSVAVTYAGGGFGGGKDSFFGNFGARGDIMASLFWEVQHLGFADRAAMRRSAADKKTAELELIKLESRIAAEVASSYETRLASAKQIDEAREALAEALESLRLNLLNMRQGAGLPRATRPIEVLQPIQALAQARLDYLDSVIAYNRAQFRLERAIGRRP